MRKEKQYIIINLIIAFCIYLNVYAGLNDIRRTAIQPRSPTQEQIKYYTDQKDFDYRHDNEKIIVDSWLEKFFDWIARQLEDLFSNKPSAVVLRYIIIAVMIVTVVLAMLKISPQKLFFKNKAKDAADIDIEELSLLQSNLDDLVRKEILKKNYRKAIRYLFLKLLKQLDEKEIIKLGIHKTNMEYQYEMRDSAYKNDFSKLSTVFEFVWYGKFSIEEPVFNNVHEEFKNVYQKLNA
ncbi:MAG: hypothetical protein V1904_11895 [Bacteroidota bacterium]